MSLPIEAYTFGTAGQACRFPMALSRRFTRNIFSSISISKARRAHFFANACGVSSLEAFCALWWPDAGAYLRAYSGPWETLAKMRPLDCTANGWRDMCLGDVYQTKMQFMNAIFRQGYEHKYAYDDETLILTIREAGFRNVVAQRFAISLDPKMAPDRKDRRTESLYVEAVKS